jgi:hypothetical protein
MKYQYGEPKCLNGHVATRSWLVALLDNTVWLLGVQLRGPRARPLLCAGTTTNLEMGSPPKGEPRGWQSREDFSCRCVPNIINEHPNETVRVVEGTMKSFWIVRVCLALVPVLVGSGCGDVDRDGAGSVELQEKLDSAQTFSGTVKDETGKLLAGARVTINGITRLTNSSGRYVLSVVGSKKGYRIDARKDGYGPATELRLTGALNLTHVLGKAFTTNIDPLVTNQVVDPASGVRVRVPANSLRSNNGAPVGTVRISIIPHTSQTMPGDFSAQNAEGRAVALVSVGAATLQAVDSQGNTLGVAPGQTLTVNLPVPASAGGTMPACVLDGSCRAAAWRFDPATALWIEQPTAGPAFNTKGTTLRIAGRQESVIDPADGVGTWNADIEFVNPACTVIEFASVPLDCYNPPPGATPEPGIEVKFTQALSGGGTKSKTSAVLSSAAFLVLYNLRANVDVDLSFAFPPGAPANCTSNLSITSTPGPNPGFPVATPVGGDTQLDSGAPWGGTGYPTDSGGNPMDLADIVASDNPCNSFVQVTTSL